MEDWATSVPSWSSRISRRSALRGGTGRGSKATGGGFGTTGRHAAVRARQRGAAQALPPRSRAAAGGTEGARERASPLVRLHHRLGGQLAEVGGERHLAGADGGSGGGSPSRTSSAQHGSGARPAGPPRARVGGQHAAWSSQPEARRVACAHQPPPPPPAPPPPPPAPPPLAPSAGPHHAEGVQREPQVEALQLAVVAREALQVGHVGLRGRGQTSPAFNSSGAPLGELEASSWSRAREAGAGLPRVGGQRTALQAPAARALQRTCAAPRPARPAWRAPWPRTAPCGCPRTSSASRAGCGAPPVAAGSRRRERRAPGEAAQGPGCWRCELGWRVDGLQAAASPRLAPQHSGGPALRRPPAAHQPSAACPPRPAHRLYAPGVDPDGARQRGRAAHKLADHQHAVPLVGRRAGGGRGGGGGGAARCAAVAGGHSGAAWALAADHVLVWDQVHAVAGGGHHHHVCEQAHGRAGARARKDALDAQAWRAARPGAGADADGAAVHRKHAGRRAAASSSAVQRSTAQRSAT